MKTFFQYIKDFYFSFGFWKTVRWLVAYSYVLMRNLTLKQGRYVVQCDDFKILTIPGDLGISRELIFFNSHEYLTNSILKQELKEGMTCFDIGACIGYSTILEAKLVGENGQVIAFEASPTNFNYLRKNVVLNRLRNVQLYSFALSDAELPKRFLVDARSNLSRIIDVKENNPRLSESIVDVPAKTLDSFCEEHHIENLDFLRIDAEGHEAPIIKGGMKTIRRTMPMILLELDFSIESRRIIEELRKIGYRIKYYVPNLSRLVGSQEDIRQNLGFDDFFFQFNRSAKRLRYDYHLILKS
ncbi:FkbM family methyltransferase [Thermoproteota archaeon]